jgi:hypothetical protein
MGSRRTPIQIHTFYTSDQKVLQKVRTVLTEKGVKFSERDILDGFYGTKFEYEARWSKEREIRKELGIL